MSPILLLDNLSKETNKTIVLLDDFNGLLNFDTSEHVSTFLDDLASICYNPDSSTYQNI